MTEINISELSTFTRVYDPVSDSWVNGTGVPTGRMMPGIVVADDILYIIGGLDQGTSLSVNEQYIPFGYHGTLPSGSGFSLDNLTSIVVLTVVAAVIVVVAVLLLLFFKKRTKPVKNNFDGDTITSSPEVAV
jgi:hypothetical protein